MCLRRTLSEKGKGRSKERPSIDNVFLSEIFFDSENKLRPRAAVFVGLLEGVVQAGSNLGVFVEDVGGLAEADAVATSIAFEIVVRDFDGHGAHIIEEGRR